MKKVYLIITALIALSFGIFSPSRVLAEDETIICPQPYGGGVVCGVKKHEPVEAGLAENLGLAGVVALGASVYFLRLSKKAREISA
jgi:hypothetical protein